MLRWLTWMHPTEVVGEWPLIRRYFPFPVELPLRSRHEPDGWVIDLHALRTTLGTQLARAGVAPQIAQRIMRHADYRTTLKHYTVLGLADTARRWYARLHLRCGATRSILTKP